MSLLLVAMATVLTYHTALRSSEQTAASRLSLQVEGFTSTLDKYRLLTPLLARRPDILAVFSSGRDEDDNEAAITEMVRISGMSDAADIQLTFLDGTRVSIANSPVATAGDRGKDMFARPDIVQAMQGRLGRFIVSDRWGRYFVFSFAARINGAVAGIVSVLVDLSGTEQIWALSPQPIIATYDERVLLSNKRGWHNREIKAEGPAGVKEGFLLEHSQFGPMLITPKFNDGFRSSGLKYVAASRDDHLLGWTFYALEPLTRAIYAGLLALILSSSLAAFGLGALWVMFNRQVMLLRQRRYDVANSLRLERRVESRTRELRRTQEGLIHSAKLAAIGQMSTVLSHEYNQPLTAIRSYAENARLLFDKGQEEKGIETLIRIENQVEKLAKLSKSLKSFARRPGIDKCAVSVDAVVEESVMLMMPQARKCAVALSIRKPDHQVRVMAGHTRLEQVLVNLIANALDAISESDQSTARIRGTRDSRVDVSYFERDKEGVIQVCDNGPGIDQSIGSEIFEPFVTSKARGVGLGLGLPIAYNLIKGFGGDLRCLEPTDARMATMFEISLPLADEDAELTPPSREEVRPI